MCARADERFNKKVRERSKITFREIKNTNSKFEKLVAALKVRLYDPFTPILHFFSSRIQITQEKNFGIDAI